MIAINSDSISIDLLPRPLLFSDWVILVNTLEFGPVLEMRASCRNLLRTDGDAHPSSPPLPASPSPSAPTLAHLGSFA